MGLSYFLTEIGLADDVAGTLLYFNIGVELGQLAIVSVAGPVTVSLFRQVWGLRAGTVLSCALALIGTYWCIERLVAGV